MDRRAWVIILVVLAATLGVAAILSTNEDGQTPSPTAAPTIAAGTTVPAPITTTTTVVAPTAAPATTMSTLAPGTTICDLYESILTLGPVASTALTEASGAAASRLEVGVIWAHNDSGDDATLYAVGPQGEDLGSVAIAGALAFDWEDIAGGRGPQPEAWYLYVGDIGDNFGLRSGRITIYRVVEPGLASLGGSAPLDAALVFDGDPHDFEAMFIADGFVYLVSKNTATVVRGDLTTGIDSPGALKEVARLGLGAQVTAAGISWDGSVIALRGYNEVWMWHRAPGATVEETLARTPCLAPAPDETQGESLTFLENGSFATISEGSNPDLHVVPRTG